MEAADYINQILFLESKLLIYLLFSVNSLFYLTRWNLCNSAAEGKKLKKRHSELCKFPVNSVIYLGQAVLLEIHGSDV